MSQSFDISQALQPRAQKEMGRWHSEQQELLNEMLSEPLRILVWGPGNVAPEAQGQERKEITNAFPVVHLAEFMEALYHTVVRQWTVDLTGPHKLTERVDSAVEFFLRAVKL